MKYHFRKVNPWDGCYFLNWASHAMCEQTWHNKLTATKLLAKCYNVLHSLRIDMHLLLLSFGSVATQSRLIQTAMSVSDAESIPTPATPPMMDCDTDPETSLDLHGAVRFVIDGNQSPNFKFDKVSSYGWPVAMARSWLNKEYPTIQFFVLTFPMDAPAHHAFVSSRDRRPKQLVNGNTVWCRNLVSKMHHDCMDRMKPDCYIEVTVVAES